MHGGFLYLVAVMDWSSRFVLSWELSNTLETGFCLAALEATFASANPKSGIPIRARNSLRPISWHR
jgi:putative transposase